MPECNVPNTDSCYYLIAFDEKGIERYEPDGSLLSQRVARLVSDPSEAITDVFFTSHGWKGDVPAAIEQYERWVGEMLRSPDRTAAQAAHPGFKAITIGIHWPSLPFGDENLEVNEGGLLSGADDEAIDTEVEHYANIINNTPQGRAAIQKILTAARRDDGLHDTLSAEVRNAYQALFSEAFPDEIGEGTLGSPPGADHGEWEPDAIYREARKAAIAESTEDDNELLGGGPLAALKGLIVSPLRQLSFWKMKDRARRIGESGVHKLLSDLQRISLPNTRFHLMGHSFGCIVVSAAVAGAPGNTDTTSAVDSLALVQGALSLWSFSADIPHAPREAGYFNRILKYSLVRGPIVITHSKHDLAVKRLYPIGARLAGDSLLADDFPKYGGLGTFGAQGMGELAQDRLLESCEVDYGFKKGQIYNLEASEIIKNGGGFSGAHSDIAHPEVAHAIWQAALTAR